ncbi:MAG: polysaccharide deacetylase family protein [Candidatus Hodarchaeaceae archaeon]|nr:polysaccharide deacetylase family protein [Candidatus Hodarchaeaceae archaeon]
MRNIALTIDVEQDVPPSLGTWRGVENGLPTLLELLSKHDIRATFFITGQVAERFPKLVKEISRRHEVACHGYRHERIDKLGAREQLRIIDLATKTLVNTTGLKVLGFRAPNFKPNVHTFEALERLGYVYDASNASYKIGPNANRFKLAEIPNTLPSSFLRLPPSLSTRVLHLCLVALPLTVLDFHVWEVVEIKGVRFDCRFATGEVALHRLDSVLSYLLNKGAKFMQMQEVAGLIRASVFPSVT